MTSNGKSQVRRAGNGPGEAAGGPSPVLLATLGAACISASAVLIKLADTGAATAAFYRCLLALPLLTVLAVLEQRRRGPRPWRARLGPVLAGVFLAVDLVLWNHAIADLGAGIATVIGNLQVVFVVAAAWALFRERPGRGFFLALPVVLAGVVLVSGLADHAPGIRSAGGIEYGLGTSVAYAAFLLILRHTSAATPHVAGPLTEVTAGAAAGAAVLGLVFGGFQLQIGWHTFGWLLVLAGVVLVSGLIDNTQRGMQPLAGIYYGLGTSVAYAFFLLILRQSTSGSPHVAGPLAEATLGCAVGALLLGVIFGGLPMPSLPSLGWLLLLALTSQTAGWLLITSSLPRLTAALSSLLLLLQPAASIVLAAIVLAERPTMLQLAGAVLVCTGVLAASRAATRPAALPAPERDLETPVGQEHDHPDHHDRDRPPDEPPDHRSHPVATHRLHGPRSR